MFHPNSLAFKIRNPKYTNGARINKQLDDTNGKSVTLLSLTLDIDVSLILFHIRKNLSYISSYFKHLKYKTN